MSDSRLPPWLEDLEKQLKIETTGPARIFESVPALFDAVHLVDLACRSVLGRTVEGVAAWLDSGHGTGFRWARFNLLEKVAIAAASDSQIAATLGLGPLEESDYPRATHALVSLPEWPAEDARVIEPRTIGTPSRALEMLRLSDVGAQATFGDSLRKLGRSIREGGGTLTWAFLDGLSATGEDEERTFASQFGLSLHDARLVDLASRETYSAPICASLRRDDQHISRQDRVRALLALGLLLFAPKGESDKFLRDVNRNCDAGLKDP